MSQYAGKLNGSSGLLTLSLRTRGFALLLAVILMLWTGEPAQADGPIPQIDGVSVPSTLQYAGQPFEIEVRASNTGSDAEGGGSITVSLPEGGDLAILDADTRILPENWTNCSERASHAWVVKPDSPCHRALQHNTSCKGQVDVRYPLGEAWYSPWRSGEQHYLKIRVTPRRDSSRVTIYVRVALRAGTTGCDLRLQPDERGALAVDQQGFPVQIVTAAVSTPTPTRKPVIVSPPTETPLPTVPITPGKATATPTQTRVTLPPAPTVYSRPPTISPIPTSTPPVGVSTIACLAVLAVLVIIAIGGGGLVYLLRQRPTPQPPATPPQAQPVWGTVSPPAAAAMPHVAPGPQPQPAWQSSSAAASIAVCTHCGATLAPGVLYCLNCGATVRLIGGRYQVLRQLGQGGMGAVYLVQDTHIPGKQWAVKEMSDAVIPTPAERQHAVVAFEQEAQLLGTLDHVNLPRVTDYLTEGTCHYLVMDYIEGQTLAELLAQRSTPFSEAEVLTWARQLCDVLSYLHTRQPQIIFRDLKPGNIMLGRDGRLKLIDFGIARLFKPGKATDTHRLGTPGYAPPEQYGKGQTDPRSDIYALGVTLHELLTKYDPTTTPFVLPQVRLLNPGVSFRTAAAIERATVANPAQRFQTVAEMKQALGAS